MITRKDDTWFQDSQVVSILTNGYTYDYAGRLASAVSDDLSTTEYGYDARGNLLSVLKTGFSTSSIYSGDVLTSVTSAINGAAQTVSFVHDALGRMTYDGTTGQAMTYNTLDLIGKVSKGGTVLANYSYLSDGTKLSALDGSGEGLVYRGPFVYRKSSGNSSLTLESASFGGGRLTSSGAILYVTDYLGSVRAVVNGSNGAICKASDYSPYGEQSDAESMQTASTPAWITLRDAYTGQEDQHPDFGTGYTDFGARQYSPALRRWMAPDPLSEKYYGISPYAFSNDNPVNFVDPDGMDIYRYDDKTGTFHLYQKNDDEIDQVGRFKYDKDTGTYMLKTKRDGSARTRIDNVEKGILKDEINLLEHSQVWSTNDITVEGFQGFIVNYSDMIGREMAGYYYTEIDGTDIAYIHSGRGKIIL